MCHNSTIAHFNVNSKLLERLGTHLLSTPFHPVYKFSLVLELFLSLWVLSVISPLD